MRTNHANHSPLNPNRQVAHNGILRTSVQRARNNRNPNKSRVQFNRSARSNQTRHCRYTLAIVSRQLFGAIGRNVAPPRRGGIDGEDVVEELTTAAQLDSSPKCDFPAGDSATRHVERVGRFEM